MQEEENTERERIDITDAELTHSKETEFELEDDFNELQFEDSVTLASIKVLLHRKSYSTLWKWKIKYIVITSDGLLHSFDVQPISTSTNTYLERNKKFDPKRRAGTVFPLSECSLVYFREEKILFIPKFKVKISDNISFEKLVFFLDTKEEANLFMSSYQTIITKPSAEYKKIRKNSIDHQIQAFCSWCLEESFHSDVNVSLIRSSFICAHCCKRTVKCLFPQCKSMARAYKYTSDTLCLVHSGIIQDWPRGDALRKSSVLYKLSVCAWCQKQSEHRLYKINFVKRNIWQCKSCCKQSVNCKNCQEGMAKVSSIFNNDFCANCDNNIVDLDKERFIPLIDLSNVEENPFGSFAPERHGINAEILIDSKDCFESMALAIENAKCCIYISFWLMCPVIRVRRSQPALPQDRLDFILKKKADDGVQVRVLLWDETNLGVTNFSRLNKEFLEGLSPNILVVRHPMLTPFLYSHHQKFVVVDDKIAFVGGIDLAWGRYDWPEHRLTDPQGVHWWGVDYYNPHITPPSTFYNIQSPDTNYFDQYTTPRMPWHDVDFVIDGEAARDVAVNFIQRWNHHKPSGYPGLLELTFDQNDFYNRKEGTCSCQILRSLGPWSGSPHIEQSIHRAYVAAIENSDYFVYIENQFFVSSTGGDGVTNQISMAIYNRIAKAIREGHSFKCIVIFPQPEEVGRWALPTLQKELRTARQLLIKLQEHFPHSPIENYISFLQLRNYGFLDNKILSDQIFVHSKLIIVDDRIAIVGSNNINDRSFLGDRDSELAVLVTDQTQLPVSFNSIPYSVGKIPHELRLRLMNEHMGYPLDDTRLSDPIESYELFCNTAQNNTKILEDLFAGMPSNRIRTWAEFIEKKKQIEVEATPENMDRIQGFQGLICTHPLYFLSDEPSTMRETIAANEMFQ